LKSLKIGEKTFNDLPVGVYRINDEKNATRGNIGIEFMKHFIVTIDWPENQIYLTPIEGREMKHNIQTFGLTYGCFDGAVRVASIYGGSDAEKKGIKIGDPVIEINGQRVDDLSEDQIQKFLHGTLLFSRDTDDSLSLIVLRDGVEKRVELFSYTLF
jgi:predicted metalloprotease with PDZ domain